MKKQLLYLSTLLISLLMMIGNNSCKKDDNPTALSLTALKSGSIEMNGATAPNTIPVNPIITATFSTNVDQATVTSSTVTLVREYDNTNITCNLSVSGATITITPTDNLASGALHKLTFTTGLKSTDGQALGANVVRTFSTIGFFAPSGMVAYWQFEDNADDAVGTFDANATIGVNYATGRKAAAGKAAEFNGTTTIIEIPNGDDLVSPSFTLSFWVKQDTNGSPQGDFVIGLAAFYGFQFEIGGDNCKFAASYGIEGSPAASFGQDMFWNGDGKTKDNGGWVACTFNKDVTASGGVNGLFKQKWAHVVCVFDAPSRVGTLYINGEMTYSMDLNLCPAGTNQTKTTGLKYAGVEPETFPELAFGFVQSRAGTLWDAQPWGGYDLPGSNHFKGMLDDVRIFNKAVTEAEVQLMYASEKP